MITKDFNNKRLAVNVFFLSQFNYGPLKWVCHNRMYLKDVFD